MGAAQHQRQPALQAAQRADPQRSRRGPRRSRSAGDRAARHHRRLDPARGGLHQHPAARADLARPVRRLLERLPGDLRRSSSPSAPTRPTCWARSCGARPGSRCSSRPPTPAARSSRPRACGRGSGSASGGSPRSSTCSRRTSATSRRCCRSPRTRTRSRSSRPAGRPTLAELRLHNGTIYRWNRPVYDVNDGVPHLRVENRVLAAGPTVADTMANAALYFGLVRALAESERPLWSQMSFSAAEENFHVAAQHGIEAQVYWPGVGQVRATELVLRRLLPLAHQGLDSWGVEPATQRPAARHHRAALPARHQRRRVVRPGAWRASRRPRPLRRPARHAARLPRAHAHQRARPHLDLIGADRPGRPLRSRGPRGRSGRGRIVGADREGRSRRHVRQAPVPGSRQPAAVDHHERQRLTQLGCGGTCRGEPRQVEVVRDRGRRGASATPAAGAAWPDGGRGRRPRASDHRLQGVGAQRVVEPLVAELSGARRAGRARRRARRRGRPDALRAGVVEHGPPQQSLEDGRERLDQSTARRCDVHGGSVPEPVAAPCRSSTGRLRRLASGVT